MNETNKAFEEITEPKIETIAAPLGTVSSAVKSAIEAATDDGMAEKIGKYHWMICALLFFATTINYIDRQVLGILATDEAFKAQIGWNEADYGFVNTAFDLEIVKFCSENEIAVMPGTLTPTEVLTAWKAGADCVKVFPCDALGGAQYLKTLKTLFPHIEMMPTGGVSLETIGDFFQAGAIAVGVGTDLVDVKAMRAGNLEIVGEKARKYLEIVKNV